MTTPTQLIAAAAAIIGVLMAVMGLQFAALKGLLTAVEARLGGRMDSLEERLDGRIDSLEERLGGRIDGLSVRVDGLDKRMDGLATDVRQIRDAVFVPAPRVRRQAPGA